MCSGVCPRLRNSKKGLIARDGLRKTHFPAYENLSFLGCFAKDATYIAVGYETLFFVTQSHSMDSETGVSALRHL